MVASAAAVGRAGVPVVSVCFLPRAVAIEMITRRNLFSSGISLTALSSNPCGRRLGLAAVRSLSLCCPALEVGAFFDREGLVANIADDMSFWFKHHVTALNWTFHSTVHKHSLSSDATDDLGM